MAPESSSEYDLQKLNVPQLKAICRDRQITAYSKLTKPLIIQKILSHMACNVVITPSYTDSTTEAKLGVDGNQRASGSTLAVAPSQIDRSNFLRTEAYTTVSIAADRSQNQAHIAASAAAGIKRPSHLDHPVSSKKTKTTHSAPSGNCEADTTTPIATPSMVGHVSPPTAIKTIGTKRPATPNSLGSTSVALKKSKLLTNKAESAGTEGIALTAAQTQRKNLLEEDPLATDVQHNSVTCNACGKVVKYAMFDLYHWNRHKMRCKLNSNPSRSSSLVSNNVDPSLTAAQSERKRVLEGDPLATNVQHDSVTCNACGKMVKYTMFDLYHWNRHKGRCKPNISSSQSSLNSNDANFSLTVAQAERKRLLEADPLATNVQHNSVTCNACGKVVKYNMFDFFHWNRHKERCKPDLSLSQSSSVTSNVADTDGSLTTAQIARKRVLEEDPLATDIQHDSVTCMACGKVVKYTMFDVYLWNKHKTRCKQDISLPQSSTLILNPAFHPQEGIGAPSPQTAESNPHSGKLTAAQACRKKMLEEDPLATDVEHSSVTCEACGKVVKYTMFDLFKWNRHKSRCKPDDVFLSVSSDPSLGYNKSAAQLSLPAAESAARGTPEGFSFTAAQLERTKLLEQDHHLASDGQQIPSKHVSHNISTISREGDTTGAKGKRFTPLVVNRKVVNVLNNDSGHSRAGILLAQSLGVPSDSVAHLALSAPSSTTKATTATHVEVTSGSKTSAALAPLSAIRSSRLRELKVATSGYVVRKASSVPDITLEVNSPTSLSLHHLDFPMSIPIVLNRISMPPALSQRKQVARFAIILSQVAIQDLSSCMLVSRMFRYATYLSASTRLARQFAGYRLNRIMHRLPVNMMNMWPYFLQREGEKKFRRRVFDESFLGRIFRGRSVIAPCLWASPDNDKQIIIAIRFLMTRLFFTISVGGGGNANGWLGGMILDAQEIIKGEIWCIDMVQPSKSLASFYVLESTCEVIGFAPLPSKAKGPLPVKMRVDWSSYIDQRLSIMPPSLQLKPGKQLDPTRSRSSIPATSLMDQLSWANHEEYSQGIGKLWLKKIKIQQEVGLAKRVVAERYILASVIENSVSGRYKTSTEMASDFAGIPTGMSNPGKKPQVKLSLFLPAHHHVESVHFTTAQGRSLHSALAIVQTPARGYYVLRDNGMQIGCEEDGVASIWMKILGCEANGERA